MQYYCHVAQVTFSAMKLVFSLLIHEIKIINFLLPCKLKTRTMNYFYSLHKQYLSKKYLCQ